MASIQKKRKATATKAEQRVADDLGGKRTFLSGAGDDKGDVKTSRRTKTKSSGEVVELPNFRVEVKTTANGFFTFTHGDWSDIVRSAQRSGHIPLFVIQLASGSRIAAIPFWLFKQMHNQHEIPIKPEHLGVKSMRVSSGILTQELISEAGVMKYLRLFLWTRSSSASEGRVVLLDYDDFLRDLQLFEESL
jgi:hypothetical protein